MEAEKRVVWKAEVRTRWLRVEGLQGLSTGGKLLWGNPSTGCQGITPEILRVKS